MTASPRVAVIGGGLGGLTVARQLNLESPTRGVDVEVLEASARVGGVIETSSDDGFVREHAANGALGSPRGGAAELAAELGLEMVPASAKAKNRWVYAAGALREVPANPLAMARTDLISARGKLRLLAEPVARALPGEPTVAEFTRHRLGDEVHDRLVAPFVSGIYAGDTEELSMLAAFPRVSEIASHGGLLRGLIGEKLGARRRGDVSSSRATSAPALGMGELTRRLAETLIGRIRCESPVVSVAQSSRGVDVVMESGKLEHFDAVVCALPAHAASSVLQQADSELGELLATVPFAPVAVVHLGYRRADIGHPLGGFGFLVAPSESLGVLGVVFESEIWENRAPEGCALLRVMVGGQRAPEVLDLDDDDLVATARRGAEHALDISGEPLHANLVRLPRAIAQYTVGHRERVERATRLAADQGVVLAGASYHGVAINSVTQDAVRAARRVHELLAAPLALALALATISTAACSGGATSTKSANGDGGAPPSTEIVVAVAEADARAVAATAAGAFREGYQVVDVSSATAGAIAVTVLASRPPPAPLSSPGRSACGGATPPRLVVHTLGGVAGAVVWIEGVTSGRDAVHPPRRRVVLESCRLGPRAAAIGRLDATLEVTSLDERRFELTISSAASPIATASMVPIGRAFEVRLETAGVYTVAGADVESGYVVVADTPYIGVTDERGQLRFDDVPAGSYRLTAWHPGVRAAEPISVAVEVVVRAGAVADAAIDLGPALR